MFINKKIILVSNSRSRALIFKKNKIKFTQISPTCDEEKIKKLEIFKNKKPRDMSLILAIQKVQSVKKRKNNFYYVGADTVVDFNGKQINKAKTLSEAKKKIKKLSGKKHIIYSSAVVIYNNNIVWKKTQKTEVFIRHVSDKEISLYLKECNKSILGSVGCYQLEENGPSIVERIKGDFFNVMGFPLFPFLTFLNEHKNDKIKT